MATQVQIYNLALLRLGEDALTATTDDTTPADRCNTVYPLALAETLNMGPEKGWRFARWRISSVDLDEKSITAFADYSGTVSGTVSATATAHGYLTGDLITISDGSVGSYDADYTITRIDADSFYFTETWVSTETATAQWTSEEYAYRFARPTCTRVTSVNVGGIPETLLEVSQEEAYSTILHEVAHLWLKHKDPMVDGLTGEEYDKQEEEANALVKQWLAEGG